MNDLQLFVETFGAQCQEGKIATAEINSYQLRWSPCTTGNYAFSAILLDETEEVFLDNYSVVALAPFTTFLSNLDLLASIVAKRINLPIQESPRWNKYLSLRNNLIGWYERRDIVRTWENPGLAINISCRPTIDIWDEKIVFTYGDKTKIIHPGVYLEPAQAIDFLLLNFVKL